MYRLASLLCLTAVIVNSAFLGVLGADPSVSSTQLSVLTACICIFALIGSICYQAHTQDLEVED